jgi:transketolase
MINSALKLNDKMFDEDVKINPTRAGFGEGLVALGEADPSVVVLTADLSESTKCDGFEKKFPQRFFDVGVAEQNMAAVAAGLGVSGKTAFIASYATFSPGKNWETIRTTIVYNEANVKVAGHHSGIATGPDGATHQATEDIAITRVWPGMDVFVPCDAIEARKATIAAGKTTHPTYLRFSREKTPVMTTDETPYEIGKIQQFWISDAPQAVIFGTGYMLFEAMLAAKELEEQGIQVIVANVATIKPLDEETIVALAQKTGAVVTIEDHQVMGGLGGAIAETLARTVPTPMEFVGLQNTFAESGTMKELMQKYHVDKDSVKEAVKKVLSRKK